MKELSIKDIIQISVVAAIYVILTVGLTALSYGDIQFRISEVLMLLIVYKRKYAISLILGCFVANLFSPVGWVDIIFGTLATVIASIPMMFIKKLEISSLFPSIANGIIVGLELAIVYELPIVLTMCQVFIGEFVVCTLIGIPLFRALETNEGFMMTIDAKPISTSKWIDSFVSLAVAVNVIGIICFFKLGLTEGDNPKVLFDMLQNKEIITIFMIILPLLVILNMLFLKKISCLIFSLIFISLLLVVFITICVNNEPYYKFYIYLIVPVLLLAISLSKYVFERLNDSMAGDKYESD